MKTTETLGAWLDREAPEEFDVRRLPLMPYRVEPLGSYADPHYQVNEDPDDWELYPSLFRSSTLTESRGSWLQALVVALFAVFLGFFACALLYPNQWR